MSDTNATDTNATDTNATDTNATEARYEPGYPKPCPDCYGDIWHPSSPCTNCGG